MKYPEIIKIRFRPTPEMWRYRGGGIDTNIKLEWEVDRDTGIHLIKYYANNWALVTMAPDAEYPLVSAVMPTCEGREKMARYAVEQFQRQTWPNKELIIVNEGVEWITEGEDNIHEVRVRPKRYENGGLHNIGDGIANGDYIIRWDDDDIHHPDRMKIQAEGAIIAASPCSIFQRRIHYSLSTDSAFIRTVPCLAQALYKNEGREYIDEANGSDLIFFDIYYRNRAVALDNWPGLYVRIWHGRNIWSEQHVMGRLTGITGEWDVGDCEGYLRQAIREYREAVL